MAALLPDMVTLWTWESELANPEYFGKVDVGGALTLEALRFTLESNDILEWPFYFWDADDKRRVRKKLERINGFRAEAHVVHRLFSVVEGVLTVSRCCADYTLQYVALRLASYDLELAGAGLSKRKHMKLLLRSFDSNIALFGKSWRIEDLIPKTLRVASLDDLEAAALHRLCRILSNDWQREIKVFQGDGQAQCPKYWVTPALQ